MRADSRAKARSAVSIVEVVVCTAIACIAMALLLPAVQAVREQGRRHVCQTRLRELCLATFLHESIHRAFPYTSQNHVIRGPHDVVRMPAVAPHRHLLAFLDTSIYSRVDFDDGMSGPLVGQMPSSGSAANSQIMRVPIPSFICPSDGNGLGGNNYRANLGIVPSPYPFTPDAAGAWTHARATRLSEFLDGLSSTALFSEKVLGDGDPARYSPFRDRFVSPVDFRTAPDALAVCRDYAVINPEAHDSFSGFTWLYGAWNHTWYNHITTPNSQIPDCAIGGSPVGGGHGVYTARSFHPGGVHVAFADGAVTMVTDAIDLATWRALSTRAGHD